MPEIKVGGEKTMNKKFYKGQRKGTVQGSNSLNSVNKLSGAVALALSVLCFPLQVQAQGIIAFPIATNFSAETHSSLTSKCGMVFLSQAETQNIYGNFEELLADVGQDSGSQVSDGFSFGNVIFQSGAVILNSSVKPLASYPIDGVYPTEKGEATQIVGTDGSAIGTITLAQ